MKKTAKSAYRNQAKKLLENTFPQISCAAINSVLNHVGYNFPEAFRILSNIQAEYPDGDGTAAFPSMSSKIKVFLKNERLKKRRYVRDPKLLEEINGIPELNTKENNPPARLANDPQEGDEEDDEEGELECGCCYGDYPPEQMRQCSAGTGHKVCKECIYRYVSEQLDGNGSVLFECIVSEECSHIYPITLLDQVLSPKLKKRTNDRLFRAEAKKAGLNVW